MILALPLVPPFPSPVTLEMRAASLAQGLPKLGATFGVPMRAAPAIGDEIAVFALRDATLEEFKTQTAETFAAEWRTGSDGTLVLNRSVPKRAAEERAAFARRQAVVRRLVGELVDEVRSSPPLTPELLAKVRRANEESERRNEGPEARFPEFASPERRLLASLVAGFPLDAFVGLSGRTVYADAPNAMQRPFPFPIAADLARCERERALLRSFALASPDGGGEGAAPAAAPIQHLLLVVRTADDDLSIELNGYDAAGRLAFADSIEADLADGRTATETTAPAAGNASGTSGAKPKDAAEDPAHAPHLFPMSAETRGFVAALGNGLPFEDARKTIDRNAARTYFDVVARDPLSFAYSDVVFEVAKVWKVSIVARPRDMSLLAGFLVEQQEPVTISEALFSDGLDRSTPGWLRVRPSGQDAIDSDFFPRADLRRALEIVDADGTMKLETAMALAAVTPERDVEPTMFALPTRLMYGRNFLDVRLLRILAAMGPAGRRRAANGMRFAASGSEVQDRLRRYIFGPTPMAIRMSELRPGYLNPSLAEGAAREPTLLLPNGIPPDARLTVVTTPSDGVVPLDPGLATGRIVTIESLASRLFTSRNPKLFSPESVRSATSWTVARLRRAGRSTTRLRLDLTPRHHVFGQHQSNELPSGPEFTVSSLPPELREAFDRAYRATAQRYEDAEPYVAPREDVPPPLR